MIIIHKLTRRDMQRQYLKLGWPKNSVASFTSYDDDGNGNVGIYTYFKIHIKILLHEIYHARNQVDVKNLNELIDNELNASLFACNILGKSLGMSDIFLCVYSTT